MLNLTLKVQLDVLGNMTGMIQQVAEVAVVREQVVLIGWSKVIIIILVIIIYLL